MAAHCFDPNNKASWYFGQMSRIEASDLLMGERECGTFLIRDSLSIQGDYVLCVREDSKVSHYIINKIQENNEIKYRIGDQMFADLPSLLAFYKLHYLDTTPLLKPAVKPIEKVVAKYDFVGNDQDDLPFRKGDILTILVKDEEQWWTAKNIMGQMGSIPVPYVQKYEGNPTLPTKDNNQIPGSNNESTLRRSSLQKNYQLLLELNKFVYQTPMTRQH
uniref:Adapter molecule Crk n=1 Tax=Melanaphis sacchari TaxID=742174 RepID=A0A2H8TXT9_9HEMI